MNHMSTRKISSPNEIVNNFISDHEDDEEYDSDFNGGDDDDDDYYTKIALDDNTSMATMTDTRTESTHRHHNRQKQQRLQEIPRLISFRLLFPDDRCMNVTENRQEETARRFNHDDDDGFIYLDDYPAEFLDLMRESIIEEPMVVRDEICLKKNYIRVPVSTYDHNKSRLSTAMRLSKASRELVIQSHNEYYRNKQTFDSTSTKRQKLETKSTDDGDDIRSVNITIENMITMPVEPPLVESAVLNRSAAAEKSRLKLLLSMMIQSA